jgi:hypothetical protein
MNDEYAKEAHGNGSGGSPCYAVVWEDRRADSSIHIFSTKAKAVGWAKRIAREYDRHNQLDETITDGMKKDGGFITLAIHARVVVFALRSA